MDNNPTWLLTRSDIKKNSINYTVLGLVNKIYQLTTLDEILKSKNPSMITLSQTQFILSSQEEDAKFQLKLISW